MKRVLALYLPFLSTDRLRRRDEAASGRPQAPPSATRTPRPTAMVVPHGGTLRIVHINEAAGAFGIRPKQTLADAKASLPQLLVYPDDPPADRRRLEALATWATRFSPIVHLEGYDTLLLDVTGSQRLFRGESNLIDRARTELAEEGFSVRAAIADTPGAAWAIAHAHCEPAVIVPPGETAAYLTSLPVWSLRIDDRTCAALSSVGVETIETLLHLPRSSLASRFGSDLLPRIDWALGDVPEVLQPHRPKPVLTSRFDMGNATTRIEVLREALRRALTKFCERLSHKTAAVRQVFVTFYCPDVAAGSHAPPHTVTLEVSLSRPTRSVQHLEALLAVRLEGLNPPAPADSLMVWARHLEPLDDRQDDLFFTDSPDETEALSGLLDRLAVRLGRDAVVRPEPLSDHQPERAFHYVPFVDASNRRKSRCNTGEGNPCGGDRIEHDAPPCVSRPLRLRSRPLEIAATALVPDGPPMAFRLEGTQHRVACCTGPERIETGWWRGTHVQRDYYRVTTDAGRHCWLFRNRKRGTWFLHGWFD